MNVVACFELKEMRWEMPENDRRRIAERFPSVSLQSIADPAQLGEALAQADAFVGFTFPRHAFAGARRLRWVHSASGGIEHNLFPELVNSDVILTSSAGVHAVSIPEHVLGQMLVLARNFHESIRLQERGEWKRVHVLFHGTGVRDLAGSRLAVLGAGAIGRNLTTRATALGMCVRVLRRNAARPVPGAEHVVGPERLHELLAWADFVVIALPLTAATHRVIDRAALAAMKSTAYLINVGRGEHIDEAALVDALRSGAIGGAALDAFEQEPLPPEHPFWKLPNLVLTPHVSGYSPGYFDRMLALFEDNLDRFVHGRPLRNVVDKQLGYAPETE